MDRGGFWWSLNTNSSRANRHTLLFFQHKFPPSPSSFQHVMATYSWPVSISVSMTTKLFMIREIYYTILHSELSYIIEHAYCPIYIFRVTASVGNSKLIFFVVRQIS